MNSLYIVAYKPTWHVQNLPSLMLSHAACRDLLQRKVHTRFDNAPICMMLAHSAVSDPKGSAS